MKIYSESLNDKKTRDYVCQNSIERILNSAIAIAEKLLETNAAKDDDYISHLLDVNLQDLQDVKPVLEKLWNEARNSIHIDEMVKQGDTLGYALKRDAEAKELNRLGVLHSIAQGEG